MSGLLISFDGLDSSGKATQASALFSFLEGRGVLVKKFESPDYTSPSGKELKLRLEGKAGDWASTQWQEKMRYFADNRKEHKEEVLDALNQNGIVIYDRYIPSSMAFMVSEAEASETIPHSFSDGGLMVDRTYIHKHIRTLECEINHMPHEDISLFFDVPPTIALTLLQARKEKHGELAEYTDTLDVQTALYEEYVRMCDEYSSTIKKITCMVGNELRTVNEISQDVRNILAQTFPEHVQLFV